MKFEIFIIIFVIFWGILDLENFFENKHAHIYFLDSITMVLI